MFFPDIQGLKSQFKMRGAWIVLLLLNMCVVMAFKIAEKPSFSKAILDEPDLRQDEKENKV